MLLTVVVSVPGTIITRTHFLLITSNCSTFPLAIKLKTNNPNSKEFILHFYAK